MIRRLLIIVLGLAAVLAALLVAAMLIGRGGRVEPHELPKPEACALVSNVIDTIARTFSPGGDAFRLDVRKSNCNDLYNVLRRLPSSATVWMPGESDWLVTGARGASTNTLEEAMDRFAALDTAFSLPEILANYVGTVAEVLPAFTELDPEAAVVPEFFVQKTVPALDWLDAAGVDKDIRKQFFTEYRSLQNHRRQLLGGVILSRKGEERRSIETWAKVYRLAPHDTLLMERMDHLRRNAEVFFKVGKFGMAGKCYETLALINPADPVAMMSLSVCYRKLGRPSEADAIERRARELEASERLPTQGKK